MSGRACLSRQSLVRTGSEDRAEHVARESLSARVVYIHVCFQGARTHTTTTSLHFCCQAGRVSWEVGVSQSCLHLRRVGSSHEEVPQS